jgi:ubiquinol-cytochrome c reductase cytochrome c1 subunit
MIRIFSILIGLFFTAALAWSLLVDSIQFKKEGLPHTVEKVWHKHPKHLALSSDGWFGKFDKQQLQRGYAVYANVCASCHSLKHVAFRDLEKLGYNEDEVKAIAAKATINAKDPLSGEMKDRPGLPSDKFPPVIYAGKGTPPDLSLITKARHGGAAYVYSLLTGYANQPAELIKEFPDAKTGDGLFYNPYFANLNIAMAPPLTGYANQPAELIKEFPDAKTGDGLFYNPYFANLNIAMAPPLTGEGQVTYSDKTKPTVDQMAKDVSAFLVWAAEPELDQRHQTGWWWTLFLVFATVLAYLSYRNIWADKKGH